MVKANKYKRLKEWGLALMLALILVLVLKGLVGSSYVVSSFKMEKTILKGDFVLVDKLSTGSRLPITLLTIPYFSSMYSAALQLPYFRIPGWNSLKQNDLVVFNHPQSTNKPIDKRMLALKRCVALPGDTIEINNKSVSVNSIEFEEPEHILNNYRLVCNELGIDKTFIDKYDIVEGGKVSDIGIYEFPIEVSRLKELKLENNLRYVRELKDFPGENTDAIFPHSTDYSFSKDFMGPIFVPFKGQVLYLNASNIGLYKNLIEKHEGNKVSVHDNAILINNILSTKYTVKYNYYFVLDDNRDNADDSRYWGFLPETHLIGRAQMIWFSYDSKTKVVRWNRIFNKLN